MSIGSVASRGVLTITPWYGGVEGGVGVATETISHTLLRTGSRCAVIEMAADAVVPRLRRGRAGELIVGMCLRPDTSLTGTLRARIGYRVRQATAMGGLAMLTARFDANVAHFHYVNDSYIPLFAICRRLGLATVLTLHGTDVNDADGNAWARVDRLLRAADAVTTVSAALFRTIVARSPEMADKTAVVPNSVPVDITAAAEAVPGHRSEPAIDVLFLGNLRVVKGPDVLLEAMQLVSARIGNVSVTIAGAGPLREQLMQRSRQIGIDHLVTFRGRVSREEAVGLLCRSRILVIPSRSEGAPLVALEAQMLGVPIVATNVGGIPESVTQDGSGMLCPPNDPTALASAVLQLLGDDALRRRLGAEGRQRAATLFSPERIASRYHEVYEQAVARRRAPPLLIAAAR
ncbi:MAG TPA: glycosyltransferase family 4 protein [Candidatus Tumulicola sp.]|nr:glycosyltransferase family 4 protein [Candidatus Tumulicola sp.]